VLDDGFQHWRLERDADIVLIDALNPFRGGLLPLGRLREPFSALKRSTAVVITRSVPGREYAGLIAEIRRHSRDVPIFRARTAARRPEAEVSSFGAFCGLGQPEAFRRTLKEIGLEPAFFEVFPDHHHYSPEEIAALKSRSAVLVTTEKDLLNVPVALRESIHPIPIEMALDDADRLLAVVSPPRTP
jgi:tetraacyldisaccharide 4'-kinase